MGAGAFYKRGHDKPEWTALLLGVDQTAMRRLPRDPNA